MKHLLAIASASILGLTACQSNTCQPREQVYVCTSSLPFDPSCCEGRVEGNRYYAPSDCFSLALPRDGLVHVEEIHYPEQGMQGVRLFGKKGSLHRAELQYIPDELFLTLCLEEHMSPESLQCLFYGLVWSQVEASVPHAWIDDEDILDLPDGSQGYFATMALPGGSLALSDARDNPALSLRSYLLFYNGQYLVALSQSDDLSLCKVESDGCEPSAFKKKQMLRMYEQYQMISNKE